MIFLEDDGSGRLHVIHAFISSTFTVTCTRADSVAVRKAKAGSAASVANSSDDASSDGDNKVARKKLKFSLSDAPREGPFVSQELLQKGLSIAALQIRRDGAGGAPDVVKDDMEAEGEAEGEGDYSTDAATDCLTDDTTSVSTMASDDLESDIGDHLAVSGTGASARKRRVGSADGPAALRGFTRGSCVFRDEEIILFAAL
jgi:hypothetical protein